MADHGIRTGTYLKVQAPSNRWRTGCIEKVTDDGLTISYVDFPSICNEHILFSSSRIGQILSGAPDLSVSQGWQIHDSEWWRPSTKLKLLEWVLAAVLLMSALGIMCSAFLPGNRGILRPCRGRFNELYNLYMPAWLIQENYLMNAVLLLLESPVAMLLLLTANKSHTRAVTYFVVSFYTNSVCTLLAHRQACNLGDDGAQQYQILSSAAASWRVLSVIQFMTLVLVRVKKLEESLLSPIGKRPLQRAAWACAVAATSFVGFAVLYYLVLGKASSLRLLLSFATWSFILAYAIFGVLASYSFMRGWGLSRAAYEATRGRHQARAKLAARAALHQALDVSISVGATLSFCVGLMVLLAVPPLPQLALTEEAILILQNILGTLDELANIYCALLLSGLLSGALIGGASVQRAEDARSRQQMLMAALYKPNADSRWQAKVEELAFRGITLEALLQFFSKLGSQVMHHYQPAIHTTEDVVRQAIIPLSSKEKCSYAEVLMKGVPTRSSKMVSHHWGNLFRDLLAAIVADALNEDSYDSVALLLDSDINKIVEWLERLGRLQDTYWLCAFAVSQHDGICGGNPHSSKDSLTKDVHPVCDCQKMKFWNDTPPLTESGHSIFCEMNKFHDMMEYLAATDPSFRQVVAVDVGFDMFNRAWCVAELVAAHRMSLSQSLKMESATSLAMQIEKLRDLKVQDMKASFQQDVEEILATIPDKAVFNVHLQELLFKTLVPNWGRLNGAEQMAQVGRVCRWQKLFESDPPLGLYAP